MFMDKLGDYDLNSHSMSTEGCLTESISYSGFLYEMALIESAMLDNVNREANIVCKTQLGVLTESAAGDLIETAKAGIGKMAANVKELIEKFMKWLTEKINEMSVVRDTWFKINTSKVLNNSIAPDAAVIEAYESTWACKQLPIVSVNVSLADLTISSNAKSKVIRGITGRSMSGNFDDIDAVRKFIETTILGKSISKNLSTLNGGSSRQNLIGLANSKQAIQSLSKLKSELNTWSSEFASIHDEQEGHTCLTNIEWAVKVINITMGVYMKASNDAFRLCRMIASAKSTNTVSEGGPQLVK